MASTAAMTMAMVPSPATAGRRQPFAGSAAAFRPMKPSRTAKPGGRLEVRASSSSSSPAREQLVAGLTAAAVAAALVIPDVAEAAQPGLSPSLKNFLFSIVAGGVVLAVIGGAVIGVANFDPVKRS